MADLGKLKRDAKDAGEQWMQTLHAYGVNAPETKAAKTRALAATKRIDREINRLVKMRPNPSRGGVIASIKGALKGQGLLPKSLQSKPRQQRLKARLKRARTPQARPKGRLPNAYAEFAIWGIPPGQKDETLLVAMPGGKPITSRKEAVRIKSMLERKHGCKACRIQKLDGSIPDFTSTLRKKNEADWYDAEDEAFRLGKAQARALGKSQRLEAKYFNVSWYSPRRGKRVSMQHPFVAHTKAGAIREAKALANEGGGKAVNFVAREVRRNPGPLDLVYGLQAFDYIKRKKIGNPGGNSDVRSPTRTSTEVRSPTKTSTSTWAKTEGNITVTGGAGAGATTKVIVKKNPSVNSLSQKFQGSASGSISEYKAASSAPSDLARIGKLILLQVEGMRGALRIPGAMVTASSSEKLWLVGKKTPMLNQKAKPGELLDFGEVSKIVYLTAKQHIGNGKTFEYDHDFESPRPHLCVDHEGMPVLRGGGYKIRAEGITG